MNPSPSEPNVAPAPLLFLRVWLAIGGQAWGGGPTTLSLIRRTLVERHGWVTEAEFALFWAMVNLAPGINLFALAILLGKRVIGGRGIFIALFGLIAPSALLTVLLTAFYTHIRNASGLQAALRGLLPATLGLGLLTTLQMLRAPLKECLARNRAQFAAGLAVVAVSGAALLAGAPVPLILLMGGVGGVLLWGRKDRATP